MKFHSCAATSDFLTPLVGDDQLKVKITTKPAASPRFSAREIIRRRFIVVTIRPTTPKLCNLSSSLSLGCIFIYFYTLDRAPVSHSGGNLLFYYRGPNKISTLNAVSMPPGTSKGSGKV